MRRDCDSIKYLPHHSSRITFRPTKPHPEIYRLCVVELGVAPEHILAIEDSPTGTEAGLHCIAFGTPFTEARLREESRLDDRWIVTDPDELVSTVDTLLDEEAADPDWVAS